MNLDQFIDKIKQRSKLGNSSTVLNLRLILFGYIAEQDIADWIKWIVIGLIEIFLDTDVAEILKNSCIVEPTTKKYRKFLKIDFTIKGFGT